MSFQNDEPEDEGFELHSKSLFFSRTSYKHLQKIPIYNFLNFNDEIITGSASISECEGGNFLGYLSLKYLAPSLTR